MTMKRCFGLPSLLRRSGSFGKLRGRETPRKGGIFCHKESKSPAIGDLIKCYGNENLTIELHGKLSLFRDLMEFPICDWPASIDDLVFETMEDLRKLYPDIIQKAQLQMKMTSENKGLAYFCSALKSIGDSWEKGDLWMDRVKYNDIDNLNDKPSEEVVRVAVATLEGLIRLVQEKFDMMDEDDDDEEMDAKTEKSAFEKMAAESMSPVTPTSVLPNMSNGRVSSYNQPLLGQLRVRAVGKLNPIDVKRLALHTFSNVQFPIGSICYLKDVAVENITEDAIHEVGSVDKIAKANVEDSVHSPKLSETPVVINITLEAPAGFHPALLPPPQICELPSAEAQQEDILVTPALSLTPPSPQPPSPPSLPISLNNAEEFTSSVQPPSLTPSSPAMAMDIAPPPPPPPPPLPVTMKTGAALLAMTTPPSPLPLPSQNGIAPPSPPPRPLGNGVAPPPPAPPGSTRGPAPLPPPGALGTGMAPPPPPPGAGRSLRARPSTKLKRSSHIGGLYRLLKGKVEGSSLKGKSAGRKGAVGEPAGGKQGMADALAEMTKRSAYFQQIEEDVQKYTKPIMEMKSKISTFNTKDMVELQIFHREIESVLEKLTDESQVLGRIEGFPVKKLETIRTAVALYKKLDGIIDELRNFKTEPPLGQFLDKVERYFNKIKGELDKLERVKDEESKKFASQNIHFDFEILVRVKEAIVDVSSSCMELALKERREVKVMEEKVNGSKTEGRRKGCTKMMWRAFQFAFRVYTFAGGHDERADKLTRELAHEIETDPNHA